MSASGASGDHPGAGPGNRGAEEPANLFIRASLRNRQCVGKGPDEVCQPARRAGADCRNKLDAVQSILEVQ